MIKSKHKQSAALIFISGIAALIYQTLWIKQLGLIVGVDVYAVTTAVSAFFAGLAIGGAIFGRKADNSNRPYFLLASLEIGIAFLGILGTITLAYSPELFVKLKEITGPFAWSLPFVIIGLPAVFMGGTLPVIIKCTAPKKGTIGKASGLLYAANTLGAIIGALLVPFLLIPGFGLIGTAFTAACLNITVATGALFMNKRIQYKEPKVAVKIVLSREAWLALGLYAFAGGIAIGYEVVWSQAVAPLLSSRVYAFAVMLAIYLFGLVSGSTIYATFADRLGHPWRAFGLLIAGAGVAALIIFASLGPWIIDTQDAVGIYIFSLFKSNMIANIVRFIFTAGVILLLPTIFLGAAFPAVASIVAKPENIGRDIGAVAALNTSGGILGTLFTGFVLIPFLGLVHTLTILALLAVITGAIAMFQVRSRKGISIVLSSLIVISVSIIAINIPKDKLARLLAEKRGGNIIFYEESAGGTVAVLEQGTQGGTFNRLYIQGISNSGNTLTSTRYMLLQGLLPLLIHNDEPRSALVIGFGTGITFGSLLSYPGLNERTCVELLPGVIKAAEYFPENSNVANDNRVDIRIKDGRHELLGNSQKYDLITLEPPPPSAAGVVNLYSTEFYELARHRLKPNGILAQWWPLATQNSEDSKSLVKSFLDVFPYVTLWSTEFHETLLVGTMEPLDLDISKIQSRFHNEEVLATMREVGVLSAVELLATYITDRLGLEKFVGDAKPVTDNWPLIEYAGWTGKDEFSKVLTEIASLRSKPTLSGANDMFEDEVEISRQKLWILYRAAYYASLGDQENWENTLKRIIPELRTNPYFKWFVPKN